jgi:hypothetical protein
VHNLLLVQVLQATQDLLGVFADYAFLHMASKSGCRHNHVPSIFLGIFLYVGNSCAPVYIR